MDGNISKIVTLKDIAEKTGFTANTVSRVLKNKENISPKTRALILDTAKEMGYVGNSLAGSLRSGLSGTIAVIISDVSNPFFGIMVKEIDNVLLKNNYCTIVLNTDENYELEEKAIYLALSKRVDGVILCPTQRSRADLHLFAANNVPYVLMGRRFEEAADDYVVWDDQKGGYLATTHLVRQGHRRILFLNGPDYISSAKERLAGYKKALSEGGIPFDPKLVRQVTVTSKNTTQMLTHLIDDGVEFSAIFAFNDLMALEAVNVLMQHGYQIPGDIAVVGFDNIQSKLILPFQLTSVSTPKTKMARTAVEILLERIRSKDDAGAQARHQVVLNTSLVVRGSS